jgi:ribosomal protein L16 Arg81 hydroxylase
MTLQEAIITIKKYGSAFENPNNEGIARYESWLPCSKDSIILAFKLLFAHLIEHQQLSQQRFDELIVPLMAIDSFVDDQQASEIDRIHKRLEVNQVTSEELETYTLYMKKSFSSKETVDHMIDYVNLVLKLDPTDSLYHQKICTYAGIEYSDEIRNSFRPGTI